MGAALAYYTVLSLAPLLILTTPLARVVLGDEAQKGIVGQFELLVGSAGAEAVTMMVSADEKRPTNPVATAISFAILLFAASNVFAELQDGLDTVWGVAAAPRRKAIFAFLRQRFLSFAMVMGVCFLLLVSLVINAGLAVLEHKYFRADVRAMAHTWNVAHVIVSIVIVTVLFAMIFRILPDATVRWRDVWVGALMTSLLFALGKFAIGKYIGNAVTEQNYGGAASLVALLVWVYYSAQILYFGAEFTHAYAKVRGSRVVPTPDAVPLTAEARAQQGIPTVDDVKATVAFIEELRPELRDEPASDKEQ
jgi:membrane protein